MTQDELNLVLDALKFCHGGEPCGTAEAISVVEKALAQQEQEHILCCQQYDTCLQPCTPRGEHLAQRTWEGLSVFEINDLVESTEYEDYQDLIERTEAKLKEKNT